MAGRPITIDGPHQIIAIGDSLTAGSQPGINEFAPFEDIITENLLPTSYPFLLGEMLSARWGGILVKNLGRSGSTSREWLPGSAWKKSGVRNFPLNGRPLDEIMSSGHDYRVCLMMIGTNDANQSMVPDLIGKIIHGVVGYEDQDFLMTKENIISCLTGLKKRGVVTYLAKIPPNRYHGGLKFLGVDRLFFSGRNAQARLDGCVLTINERIDEIWRDYPDLALKGPDFFCLFRGTHDIWLQDRLHLNTGGYRLMAHAWASLLSKDGIIIRDA